MPIIVTHCPRHELLSSTQTLGLLVHILLEAHMSVFIVSSLLHVGVAFQQDEEPKESY
jgi:hypothetical protein